MNGEAAPNTFVTRSHLSIGENHTKNHSENRFSKWAISILHICKHINVLIDVKSWWDIDKTLLMQAM